MADIRLTALPSATVVANGDLLYLVHDPTGAPVSQKTTVGALLALAAPPLPTAALNQVLVSQGAGVQPVFSSILTLGPNAANTGGPIRLENNAYIMWRDGGNTGNTSGIKIDSTNNLIAGTNFYPDNAFLNLGSNTKRWMNVWVGTAVAIGAANSASTGDIRLTATGSIWARNAANTADIRLLRVNADTVTWGVPGNPIVISGQTIAFNVTPTAPTAPPGTDDTQLATTAFVKAATTGGGAVAAHQATHRPGGTDVLVNAAWIDQANVFTDPIQTIQGVGSAQLVLKDTTMPVDNRTARLLHYQQYLQLDWMNDANTAVVGASYRFGKVEGFIYTSPTTGPQLKIIDSTQPVDLRMWRIQNIGQQLQFHATNDAVTANTATITLDRTGNMVLPGKITATKGGFFPERVLVGPATGLGNAAFNYVQFEVHSPAGHAGIVWTDTSQPADNRKWRIVNYQQELWVDTVNDIEGAQTGAVFKFNKSGAFVAPGSITTNSVVATTISSSSAINANGGMNLSGMLYIPAGGVGPPSFNTRSAGTKIVLYPNLGPSTADYALGIDGGTFWFSTPPATGNTFRWYEGTTSVMSLGSGVLTIGNVVQIGGDSAANPGMPWIRGNGVNHLVINGPQGGYVYLGLDSGSYSWISGMTVAPGGGMTCTTVNTGALVCTSINSQGYGVYFGPVSCGAITAPSLSAGGTARIGNIYIQADSATNNGLPWIRAAASMNHMVINAVPLYLNLDVPGNQILVYGPVVTIYGINPNTDGTQHLGASATRWQTAFFALTPDPGGSVAVVTGANGGLYYSPSSRRYKKNERPSELAKSKKILELDPIYYQHLESPPGKDEVIGLMIEDIPEELGDLVTRHSRTTDLGTELIESLHYERVAMHLLIVMKDMQRRIDELEARIH